MSAMLPRISRLALLATSALAAPGLALAQAAPAPASEGSEIIVTAQKRSESLQNVPISIQALSTKKLDELNVASFNDYAQQLPSVTFQALGGTPGTNVVYMRGVASGGDGNHSGSLPSVGVYLDEQPVTTIGGNLDVHIYDVARIESLSGPQGTLYGASSEAGTIRIITNKPDHKGFYGRIDGELNTVHNGTIGGKVEGMINAPLSQTIALRVVGFYQRDSGFIDNRAGTRTFCGGVNFNADGTCVQDGISVNNNAFVKKHYNDTETAGGRAALKIDLGEHWTVTPAVMYQDTRSHGSYGYDPSVGDLAVQHFYPEYRSDKFMQAALTVEGKLGNWDVTYAGAYLDRKDLQSSDYTDYAEAYDSLYSGVGGLAGYFYYKDAAGNNIDPRQHIIGTDHFKKTSQEFRISSPSTAPLRLVAGLFYQYQSNDIHQDYQIPNLAPSLSVNGLPGTVWLTQQHRIDKDYAAFGELSYDVLPKLTLTAGGRVFKYDNSLIGFFGFGRDPAYVQGAAGNPPPNAAGSTRTGVAGCFTSSGLTLRDAQSAGTAHPTLLPAAVAGSPCTNLGVYANGSVRPVSTSGDGVTYRFNATYKFDRSLMVYATVSRGFRPGGINRRAGVNPYAPDYLTNFELGFKSTLANGLLRLNGAIYQQNWNSFQFSYLGLNSFTEIHNGPNARIRGFDMDATVNLDPLTLNLSAAYTDAKTLQNLCQGDQAGFACNNTLPDGRPNIIAAPAGTRLPVTPQFKMSGTARYTMKMDGYKLYGQLNGTYQSSAASDLRTNIYLLSGTTTFNPAATLGRIAAFGQVNTAVGAEWDKYSIELFVQNLFDERGQLSRFQECGTCGQRPYIVPNAPRTIGLRIGGKF